MPKKISPSLRGFGGLAGFVLSLLAFSVGASTKVVLSKSVDHYLGGDIIPFEITQHFDCRDRIYATFQLPNTDISHTTLQFKWRAPNGAISVLQKVALPQGKAKKRLVSRWMSLSGASGNRLFTSIGLGNPYAKYIGEWLFIAELDGIESARSSFEVLC